MMLNRVKHSRTLPVRLTSHQMLHVSRRIHKLVTEVVTPLVDSKPHYQAVSLTLGQLETATQELARAQTRRKYKSPRQMRGVGGVDGLTDETTLSQQKRLTYERRKTLMRRIRQMVVWKKEDAAIKGDTDLLAAANDIGRIVSRRMDGFEFLSYEESTSEFEHFIDAMDGDASVPAALALLELSEVYADLKQINESFLAIHVQQTLLDSKREDQPRLLATKKDLRRVVRVLLTLMHFDIESGDNTFNPVLGHVDELIDKVRAVSKRRTTLSQSDTDPPSDDDDSDTDSSDSDDSVDADDSNDSENASGSGDAEPAGNAGDTSETGPAESEQDQNTPAVTG